LRFANRASWFAQQARRHADHAQWWSMLAVFFSIVAVVLALLS
jgi:hypothetical protein